MQLYLKLPVFIDWIILCRQQLEQAMQQEAAARTRQEEVSGRQWAAQEAERAAAAAAAQRARWQQAQNVAASQLQQIADHQATRCMTWLQTARSEVRTLPSDPHSRFFTVPSGPAGSGAL